MAERRLGHHLAAHPLSGRLFAALLDPILVTHTRLKQSPCSRPYARRQQSRQQPRQRKPWLTPPRLRATAGADAVDADARTLFAELAASHCVPPTCVGLARTPEGLGWVLLHAASRPQPAGRTGAGGLTGGAGPVRQPPHQQLQLESLHAEQQPAAEADQPTILIKVPLRLCLSHEIPFCCPGARSSGALAPVLSCADEAAAPWEVVLAALLVWACRLPDAGPGTAGEVAVADPGFARFWRRYRALLPAAAQQTSLTFWKEQELQQLQDDSLASEAEAWQATVLSAYRRFIDTPASREELGPGAVTLREWLEAVGAVESRAFGFKSDADGREQHAYLPFFCLANYRPGAPTLHVLRLKQPEGATGDAPASAGVSDLAWQPTADMVAWELPRAPDTAAASQDGSSTCADLPQVFIDYGKKDSRSLVLQYGFVIHGNLYDRLEWEGCGLGPLDRMRREWVHEAAEALAQRLEQLARAGAGGAAGELGGAAQSPGTSGCGTGAGVHGADLVRGSEAALEREQLLGPGGAAAARVRLRSAAASIVAACGWRSMRERRLVTGATEARAVTALESWTKARLEDFPTSLESDLLLLAGLSGTPGATGAVCSEDGGQPRGTLRVGHSRVSEASGADEKLRAPAGSGDAAAGCSKQEFEAAVGDVPARTEVAIRYRVERKLLLGGALLLLGRLRTQLPAQDVVDHSEDAAAGAGA